MNTGLSAVIGSWNTIAMRLPRTRCIVALVERDEVASLEADRAAGLDAAGRADEAQDRERRDGLAAARLADDADRLAGADGERHAVHGARDAVVGIEVGAQVVELEQRCRSCVFW